MFVSGRVESECEHLLAQLSYPKLPVLSDTTLSLVGVSGDGRDTIGAILDTYNRGNLLNMVSLSALLAEPVTPPILLATSDRDPPAQWRIGCAAPSMSSPTR